MKSPILKPTPQLNTLMWSSGLCAPVTQRPMLSGVYFLEVPTKQINGRGARQNLDDQTSMTKIPDLVAALVS